MVPPLGRFVVVETGISTGNAAVGVTEFSFSTTPAVWEHIPEAVSRLRISTSEAAFDTSGVVPRLSATLLNSSLTTTLENTTVGAVLYDADDNAINVSKTFIPELKPGAKTQVVFTWPHAFSTPVVRYDIVPIIDVFHTE